LIYGYFQVEVNAWWEWFLTTMLDDGPTEFIAVENRSHNIFKRCSGTKGISTSIKLATTGQRSASGRTPDTLSF